MLPLSLPKGVWEARRWLKPGGKVEPATVSIWIAAADFSVPHKYAYDRWAEPLYGVDLSALKPEFPCGVAQVRHGSGQAQEGGHGAQVLRGLSDEGFVCEVEPAHRARRVGFVCIADLRARRVGHASHVAVHAAREAVTDRRVDARRHESMHVCTR